MAAGRKGELVPRPSKKVEYDIRFASSGAKKGWRDLVATMRNPMADAWDFLTRTPTATTSTNYRLKGELGDCAARRALVRAVATQTDAERFSADLVLRRWPHGLPRGRAHQSPERDEVAPPARKPLVTEP